MKNWIKKAAGIIFTDGKKILLLKRAGEGEHIGKWALPGGKSKGDETEIGNAIRETKEETGLGKIPGYRFDSMETRDGERKFSTFFYKVQEPFDVTLSKEHSEFCWAGFEELDRMELHPKMKKSLPDYLHKIRNKVTTFAEWTVATHIMKKAEA